MGENLQRMEKLRAHLLARAEEADCIAINSPLEGLPYIVNLSVEGFRSEILLHFLEEKGIYVSSGSACSRGEKSHGLGAMGLSQSRIDSALRISFGASLSMGTLAPRRFHTSILRRFSGFFSSIAVYTSRKR